MEYRGVEFTVVRTIPTGWRWSVKRDQRSDKVGTAFDREGAILHAKRFIDSQLKSPAKDVPSGA
jgi:hypothetical protein